METYRNPKKVCSMIGFALLGMMTVWLGSMYLLSYLARDIPYGTLASLLQESWGYLLINDMCLYLLGVPVFLLVLHFLPDGPQPPQPRPHVRYGPGKFTLTMMFNVGATWLFSIISALIIMLIVMLLPGARYGTPGLEISATNWPTNLLFIVFIPAIGEEFLFRYMLRRKMRGCADKTYIFMSGLCFGLFHANLSQLLFAFVLGAVFAWVYTITNKLWIPMLMHAMINSIGAIAAPLLIERFSNFEGYDWVLLSFYAIIMMIVIFTFIVIAIVFFFVFKRYVFGTMQPPHEKDWPYKPPKPKWYVPMYNPTYAGYGGVPYTQPGYQPMPYYTPAPVGQPSAAQMYDNALPQNNEAAPLTQPAVAPGSYQPPAAEAVYSAVQHSYGAEASVPQEPAATAPAYTSLYAGVPSSVNGSVNQPAYVAYAPGQTDYGYPQMVYPAAPVPYAAGQTAYTSGQPAYGNSQTPYGYGQPAYNAGQAAYHGQPTYSSQLVTYGSGSFSGYGQAYYSGPQPYYPQVPSGQIPYYMLNPYNSPEAHLPGSIRFCLGNLGMILFTVAASIMLLINLIVPLYL